MSTYVPTIKPPERKTSFAPAPEPAPAPLGGLARFSAASAPAPTYPDPTPPGMGSSTTGTGYIPPIQTGSQTGSQTGAQVTAKMPTATSVKIAEPPPIPTTPPVDFKPPAASTGFVAPIPTQPTETKPPEVVQPIDPMAQTKTAPPEPVRFTDPTRNVKAVIPESTPLTQAQDEAGRIMAAQGGGRTAENQAALNAAEAQSLDILAKGMQHAQGMMTGNDPIARATFNNWLNSFGTANQAQKDGLMMKLRQQPGFTEGSGEGNALLAMMARDQGAQLSDMIGKMSVESLTRISDWNKWGVEKATEIQRHVADLRTRDLQDTLTKLSIADNVVALENSLVQQGETAWDNKVSMADDLRKLGAYQAVADLFPGMGVDAAYLASQDPAKGQAYSAFLKTVEQLVSQGDAQGAKDLMVGAAARYYREMGFGSAEEAAAAMGKMDFSQDAWAARNTQVTAVQGEIRKFVAQGDEAGAKDAIRRQLALRGQNAATLGESVTLEQFNDVSRKAGIEPESDLLGMTAEERYLEYEYRRMKSESRVNAVDMAIEDAVETGFFTREQLTDPTTSRMIRAYFNGLFYGGNLTLDDSSPTGYKINANTAVRPWEDDTKSHYFTTWPHAEFGPDGKATNILSRGGEPHEDQNTGTVGVQLVAEEERLNQAYNRYLAETKPAERLSRQGWYYATAGGKQPANPDNVPGGVEPKAPVVGTPEGGPKPGEGEKPKVGALASLTAPELQSLASQPEKVAPYIANGDVKEVKTLGNLLRPGDAEATLKAAGLLDKVASRTSDTFTFQPKTFIYYNGSLYEMTKWKTGLVGTGTWSDKSREGILYGVNAVTGKEEVIKRDTRNL